MDGYANQPVLISRPRSTLTASCRPVCGPRAGAARRRTRRCCPGRSGTWRRRGRSSRGTMCGCEETTVNSAVIYRTFWSEENIFNSGHPPSLKYILLACYNYEHIEFRVLKLCLVKILGCVYFGDWNYLSVKASIFVNSGKSFMCISCTSTFNKCKQYILILISCSCVPLAICITMGM